MDLLILVSEDKVKDATIDYLKDRGYEYIIPEYQIFEKYSADFVATNEHNLLAIECKGSDGRFQEALGQAIIYKRACDSVYIAIPNEGFNYTKIEEDICANEGIGILLCHFDMNGDCIRTEEVLQPKYDPKVSDLEMRFIILNDLLFENKGKGRDPQLSKIHRVCEVVWFVSNGIHNRQILIDEIIKNSNLNSPRTANIAINMSRIMELIKKETQQSYILTESGYYLAKLLSHWSKNIIKDLSLNNQFSDLDPIQSQILSIFRLKCFNFQFVKEVFRVLVKLNVIKKDDALTCQEIMKASSHHRPTDIESIKLSANYLEEVKLIKAVIRPKKYYLNINLLHF